VVVDRSEQEGRDNLAQQGIQLLPILTLDDLKQTISSSS
jgi:orotate phosphoribosyltransferase